MSSAVSSFTILGAGIFDGSQRFVSDRASEEDRPVQQRFVTSLLIGPFVLAAIWIVAAAAGYPAQVSVVTLLAIFICAWSSVALVNWTGSLRPVAAMTLSAAAGFAAWMIAAAGGFSSPLALLALALVPEVWWVMRTRSSVLVAAAASGAALAAVPAIQFVMDWQTQAFVAWQWLVPAGYALVAAPHLMAAFKDVMQMNARDGATGVEEIVDAAFLRFTGPGDIVEADGRIGETFGVATALLLGNGLFERIHVGDRVAYMHALSGLTDGEKRQCAVRVRMPADDAGHVYYRPLSVEVYGGAPGLMVLRDDTAAHQLREQIAELRNQLAEGEVAKASFLATVSHELRTPLNAIIGFSDMMEYGLAGPFADPRQAEYTRIIRESGSHLLAVVNAILDISRIESRAYSIKCEPFRFAEAASACHEMLTMQAREKSIELRNEVLPSAGEINGDRRAVQQVLINLLSNAIKFTPKGGVVCVSARRSSQHLIIDVSDTGIGIEQCDLERLGRPFVQLRNDYSREQDGVGLGLSIAKGLIALHDGAMTIASAPGAGTTVTVRLPLAGPAVAAGEFTPDEEGGSHAAFRKSA